MKHYLFLILLLLISCKKKEVKKEIIPKDENLDLKYEVLNQLIDKFEAEDSELNYVYNISLETTDFDAVFYNRNEPYPPPPPPNFGIKPVYDGHIFLQVDSLYYQNQAEIFRNFKLNKNRIKRKLQYTNDEELEKMRRIKGGYFWDEFRKKNKNKCLRTLSVPFFNKDKTACVVLNSLLCDPLEGEIFHIAVYKKTQGIWKEIRSYDYTIG